MKKCNSCQQEIDPKATKCPHCQTDQRSWRSRHKILTIILAIIGVLLVIGAAGAFIDSSDTSSPTSSETTSKLKIPAKTEGEIAAWEAAVGKSITYDMVDADPDKYKGRVVKWGGKVFVEYTSQIGGIQIYYNGGDNNFIATYKQGDFEKFKEGDYVIVIGRLKDKFHGTNAFGGEILVPQVEVGYIKESTRSEVVAPTSKTITVGKSNTQHGVTITLDKIELSDEETRVFLSIDNKSSGKISFSTYDAKLIQGSKQLEPKTIFDDSEELPSEILKGVKASGVIVFPKVESTPNELKLNLSAPYSSDDYLLEFKDIIFNVNLP